MAKLSSQQKKNIQAKWDTGNYSKTELAKKYKISEGAVRKIVGIEEPKNADIVKVQTELELFKKCEKSTNEISAINHAVKENLKEHMNKDKLRDNVFETGLEIVKGIKALIKKGKAQKPTTANTGDGIIESNIIEFNLQAIDYKNAAEGLDKVAVTLEVVPRCSAQNNLTLNQQNNTKVIGFEEIETIPR